MRSFGTLLARSVSASQLQGAGFDRELGLPTRRFSTCPCGFPPDSVSLPKTCRWFADSKIPYTLKGSNLGS